MLKLKPSKDDLNTSLRSLSNPQGGKCQAEIHPCNIPQEYDPASYMYHLMGADYVRISPSKQRECQPSLFVQSDVAGNNPMPAIEIDPRNPIFNESRMDENTSNDLEYHSASTNELSETKESGLKPALHPTQLPVHHTATSSRQESSVYRSTASITPSSSFSQSDIREIHDSTTELKLVCITTNNDNPNNGLLEAGSPNTRDTESAHVSDQGCSDSDNISLPIPAVVIDAFEYSIAGNASEARGESILNNLSSPTPGCAAFGEFGSVYWV